MVGWGGEWGSFLSANPLVEEIPLSVEVLKLGSMDHIGGEEERMSLKLGGKHWVSSH